MSRTPYSPFVEKATAPEPWKLVRCVRGSILVAIGSRERARSGPRGIPTDFVGISLADGLARRTRTSGDAAAPPSLSATNASCPRHAPPQASRARGGRTGSEPPRVSDRRVLRALQPHHPVAPRAPWRRDQPLHALTLAGRAAAPTLPSGAHVAPGDAASRPATRRGVHPAATDRIRPPGPDHGRQRGIVRAMASPRRSGPAPSSRPTWRRHAGRTSSSATRRSPSWTHAGRACSRSCSAATRPALCRATMADPEAAPAVVGPGDRRWRGARGGAGAPRRPRPGARRRGHTAAQRPRRPGGRRRARGVGQPRRRDVDGRVHRQRLVRRLVAAREGGDRGRRGRPPEHGDRQLRTLTQRRGPTVPSARVRPAYRPNELPRIRCDLTPRRHHPAPALFLFMGYPQPAAWRSRSTTAHRQADGVPRGRVTPHAAATRTGRPPLRMPAWRRSAAWSPR